MFLNVLINFTYLFLFFGFIEIRQFILLHMLNKGKDVFKRHSKIQIIFKFIVSFKYGIHGIMKIYFVINYLQHKNNDSPIYKTRIMIIVKMFLHIKYFINLKIILRFI